ncbi:hypothetical protein HY256_11550, partial [Candidatus Sumerlaeota bacterium]|nr:hypothetical protein [Candidatus Sumerlaeota bacterium]
KQTPDGWVYCMEPWPDHATVFHRLELSYEALKREEEHRKELDRMLLKNKLAPLYDFMVGFLPASMQEQLSDRWDFDPVSASRKNARVTQYIGFFMTAGNMVFSPPLAIAGICIFFDGFIRRAYTIAHDQPCGLLVFEMVDRLFFKQIEKFFHREDRPRPLDERDWED